MRPGPGFGFTIAASRVVLGLMFVVASAHKILFPHDFAEAVFRYQLLPYGLVNIVAVFLPWLELATGVALLAFRSHVPAAAVLVAGMLVVFTAALGVNLARGIDVACGCFSTSPGADAIGLQSIFRNVLMIVLAIAVFCFYPRLARASKKG
jgi:hypothetical protein